MPGIVMQEVSPPPVALAPLLVFAREHQERVPERVDLCTRNQRSFGDARERGEAKEIKPSTRRRCWEPTVLIDQTLLNKGQIVGLEILHECLETPRIADVAGVKVYIRHRSFSYVVEAAL